MSNKLLRNFVQNLALLSLTALALFLLSQLPSLRGVRWTERVRDLLEPTPAAGMWEQSGVPAEILPSVQLLVTGDSEYGRYGRLNVPSEDPVLQTVTPLFQEAVGSATEVGTVADTVLRTALNGAGFYLDLTASAHLPLAALEPWLGDMDGLDREVRALALTAEEEGFARLFLLGPGGEIWLYETALPVSAVRAACGGFPPNGACFSYETSYGSLEPYTVLTAQPEVLPDLTAELPAGYSTYNLLTALDFNAHTLSRYNESGGTEVVEESPRTLRIGPNGAVSFTSRGEIASHLFRTSSDTPELRDIMAAGWRLAAALTEGTGASPLRLRAAEKTEDGYILRFRYEEAGTPVVFSDAEDALSVTFRGGQAAAFTYRCRSYTPVEGEPESGLLPAFMARAMAAIYPNASLSIGYEDSGGGMLRAEWVAGSAA
ncbi:MAG: hypothetical protein K2N78_05310 [Oscillospiraceae bacterium]|nr:hypothetical protein [Oscillospiraceae bacterium]